MRKLPKSIVLLLAIGVLISGIMLFTQVGVSTRRTTVSQNTWARLAGPLQADDEAVLSIIRDRYLHPPSTLPYNFSNRSRDIIGSNDFTWPWIHKHLAHLFSDQQEGFFVEAGALDGVYLSNTLWLERNLGWSGLFIEPDTESYSELLTKHRKVWSSNTCLSSEPYPKKAVLVSRRVVGKTIVEVSYWWAFRGRTHELRKDQPYSEELESRTDSSYSIVQCFPLLSYLLALNVSKVDLLSLDIQGTEPLVLRSILTSKRVSLRVIVVEDELKRMNQSHMETQGYQLVASNIDQIYIKKGDPLLYRMANFTV